MGRHARLQAFPDYRRPIQSREPQREEGKSKAHGDPTLKSKGRKDTAEEIEEPCWGLQGKSEKEVLSHSRGDKVCMVQCSHGDRVS